MLELKTTNYELLSGVGKQLLSNIDVFVLSKQLLVLILFCIY